MLIFFNLPLEVPTYSLMLTQEERQPTQKSYKLQGILFHTESEWTIWINNQRYQPDDIPDGFHIQKVTPESVEIVLCQEEQGKDSDKTLTLTM